METRDVEMIAYLDTQCYKSIVGHENTWEASFMKQYLYSVYWNGQCILNIN